MNKYWLSLLFFAGSFLLTTHLFCQEIISPPYYLIVKNPALAFKSLSEIQAEKAAKKYHIKTITEHTGRINIRGMDTVRTGAKEIHVMKFDSEGRMLLDSSGFQTVKFKYDKSGKLINKNYWGSNEILVYSSNGQLAQSFKENDLFNEKVFYYYNNYGDLEKIDRWHYFQSEKKGQSTLKDSSLFSGILFEYDTDRRLLRLTSKFSDDQNPDRPVDFKYDSTGVMIIYPGNDTLAQYEKWSNDNVRTEAQQCFGPFETEKGERILVNKIYYFYSEQGYLIRREEKSPGNYLIDNWTNTYSKNGLLIRSIQSASIFGLLDETLYAYTFYN